MIMKKITGKVADGLLFHFVKNKIKESEGIDLKIKTLISLVIKDRIVEWTESVGGTRFQ